MVHDTLETINYLGETQTSEMDINLTRETEGPTTFELDHGLGVHTSAPWVSTRVSTDGNGEGQDSPRSVTSGRKGQR